MGGGNFPNRADGAEMERQFALLKRLGLRHCRFNVYPGFYLVRSNWDRPNATVLDEGMKLAHAHGVTPMILFEYYASYHASIRLGTEKQWHALGRAFAERYRPGGTWGREHGVAGWGVTLYSAFNEPERGFGTGGKLGPGPYVAALKGLADGVHSVDPSLRVIPGGFMAANARDDWALRGLGPALAPLLNDGTLDGIDLHTYYDVQYAPMEGTYANSAQDNFDRVKAACGITRDVSFYCTEFNYKKRRVTTAQAARGFLTGIWDHLGVVRRDGRTPAARLALPWNLFHDAEKDTQYGMLRKYEPYEPSPRGAVLQLVLRLTDGMRFTSLDPRKTGVFVLEGAGRKMWVWQNRKGWTDQPGPSFTVRGVPAWARKLEVYGWDGLRTARPLDGRPACSVTDLPGDETYMFVATR
jgi:hypothetical protein